MAYYDALFQLGMDLTRSSTTQKEDPFAPMLASEAVRKDQVDEAAAVEFASTVSGNRLTVELTDIDRLDDLGFVETFLKRSVDKSGAHLQHIHLYRFAPRHPSELGGVAGVVMVKGGHLSLHSKPALKMLSIDVFMDTAVAAQGIAKAVHAEFRAHGATVTARPLAAAAEEPVQLLKKLRRSEPKSVRSKRAA
jgi:S-adenosylmethionine decarboxylase